MFKSLTFGALRVWQWTPTHLTFLPQGTWMLDANETPTDLWHPRVPKSSIYSGPDSQPLPNPRPQIPRSSKIDSWPFHSFSFPIWFTKPVKIDLYLIISYSCVKFVYLSKLSMDFLSSGQNHSWTFHGHVWLNTGRKVAKLSRILATFLGENIYS